MDSQRRKAARIVQPQYVVEGAGVRLRRSIAGRSLDYVDPFLLFDDFGSENPEDYLPGFPMHPHRGIETVTYVLKGAVQHKDSMGNVGTIRGGDVQWMTSGRGILHEEMPRPEEKSLIGFQLWVNLPARLKMTRPRYQEIPSREIPEVSLAGGSRVRVIAGDLEGVKGPVKEIAADPTYLDVRVGPLGSFSQRLERDHATLAYVFEGEGDFGETEDGDRALATSPRLLVFGDGDHVSVEAGASGVRFLLISGKPLNEPVARHGPFVMNTQEEIRQALQDLRAAPSWGSRESFPPDSRVIREEAMPSTRGPMFHPQAQMYNECPRPKPQEAPLKGERTPPVPLEMGDWKFIGHWELGGSPKSTA